jgi:NitT/TauT family transport system ATP-binding protein
MSATPGRIIDTLELGERRNRSVDKVDTAYIANRNRIMGLLRHRDEEPAAAPPRRATA